MIYKVLTFHPWPDHRDPELWEITAYTGQPCNESGAPGAGHHVYFLEMQRVDGRGSVWEL